MPSFRGWTEVRRQRRQLQEVVGRARDIDDISVQADYARLILVETSGFVETALQELLQETCRRQASGQALNYAMAQLEWSRNPTTDAIADTLKQFSLSLADTWNEMLLASPERKAALNSTIGLRNAAAHGDRPTVSLGRTLGYLSLIDELVEWLIAALDPAPDSVGPFKSISLEPGNFT